MHEPLLGYLIRCCWECLLAHVAYTCNMPKRSMHPRPDTGSDQMLFQTGCICQRDAQIPDVMLDLIYFGEFFFDMLHLSKMYDIAILDQLHRWSDLRDRQRAPIQMFDLANALRNEEICADIYNFNFSSSIFGISLNLLFEKSRQYNILHEV